MASPVVIPTVTSQGREFWVFYRRYTDTTIHTASTVVLAIFGILVFLDPWFAALAISSYVLPPVVLYILADDPVPGTEETEERDPRHGRSTDRTDRTLEPATAESNTSRPSGGHHSRTGTTARPDTAGETGTGGTDSDSDSDSDSDDGDTDSDSDSDDGDTDSDSDGTDTDTDSDDGDTDSDSDG